MVKPSCFVLLVVAALTSPVHAYGPQGHELVGAIADHRLKGRPTEEHLRHLLDGLTLAEAALIPDQIKAWDERRPRHGRTVLQGHPEVERQMIAFHRANPHGSPGNDHRAFHYTDVPVEGSGRYGEGAVGRSTIDIVHMTTYCIDVLTGDIPEDNPRRITKPVAVILLAHFLGDIHQPLHVGAEYFNDAGVPVNPDVSPNAHADLGGNAVALVISGLSGHGHGHGASNPSLHSFWDDAAVTHALHSVRAEMEEERPQEGEITADDLAKHFAANDPGGLEADAGRDPDDLAEAWADEILPIARDAHERLTFSRLAVSGGDGTSTAIAHRHGPKWLATEKSPGTYADFAGEMVRQEIHKGGWRLAALLERIVD